jgi:hypothetical protein
MEKDTHSLNNAVFYDRNKQNNIFYDMKDQISQLKGEQAAFKDKINATVNFMQRGIDEARFRQTNFENKVDGFKSVIDKFDETLKTLAEMHKSSVEQAIGKT